MLGLTHGSQYFVLVLCWVVDPHAVAWNAFLASTWLLVPHTSERLQAQHKFVVTAVPSP